MISALINALAARQRSLLAVGSFVLPVLVWCLVSYSPYVWHPKVMVTAPGAVDYFQPGMLVDREEFASQLADMRSQGTALPEGEPANPIYLPAPHQVATALYTAFTKAPESRDGRWLHESL